MKMGESDLIYFCQKMKSEIPFKRSKALTNLYDRQINDLNSQLNNEKFDLNKEEQEAISRLQDVFQNER